MKKFVLAIVGMMAVLGALGDSWTDPETGLSWSYMVKAEGISVGTVYFEGVWSGGVEYACSPALSLWIEGPVSIPATICGMPVVGVSSGAFKSCGSLTSITIPAGVTSIDHLAFEGCANLKSISIPGSVMSIGGWAFDGCGGLGSGVVIRDGWVLTVNGKSPSVVTLPEDTKGIAGGAFSSCSNLTSIVMPESMTSIGGWAFSNCSKLRSVTIPESLMGIGGWAFNGCSGLGRGVVIRDGWVLTVNGTCPSVVTLPEGTKGIAGGAFSSCSNLTSITIPSSVTSIGGWSFEYCSKLRSIAIPLSVMCIEEGAFRGCTGLTTVTISSSVMIIENGAFEKCPTLKTIYVDEGDEFRICSLLEDSGFDTADVAFKVREALSATFILGAKSTEDVELVGYKASALPPGLSYDAKKGTISGMAKVAGEYEVTFTKAGEDDVVMTIVVRKENEPTIDCPVLDAGEFTAGVVGTEGGIPLDLDAESGVKSLAMKGQPSGWKLVQDKTTKAWTIQGAATKTGTFNVTLTMTTAAGTKVEKKYAITVSALHEMAVGTYNGFVTRRNMFDVTYEKTFGAIQVTTTDAGKITAKITAAAKTYSFSAASWDRITDSGYEVSMALKSGETLFLVINPNAGWSEHQLTGRFAFAMMPSDGTAYEVSAQRNAFGKQWYFLAKGNETDGWTFSYADNVKAANLTVTLNADGKTSIAGLLVGRFVTFKVSASGYCDVSGLADGGIIADFAPVMTMNKEKKVLSIRTNLWFDRTNDHDLIGSAKLVE